MINCQKKSLFLEFLVARKETVTKKELTFSFTVNRHVNIIFLSCKIDHVEKKDFAIFTFESYIKQMILFRNF